MEREILLGPFQLALQLLHLAPEFLVLGVERGDGPHLVNSATHVPILSRRMHEINLVVDELLWQSGGMLKGKNGWLWWRDDPAYSGSSGSIRVADISAIMHGSATDESVQVFHRGGDFAVHIPATVEEVMTIVETESGSPPMSQVIVEQAAKIRALEEELEKARELGS